MPTPPEKNLRFLVVDDQFNVRRMIQNFLRTFGYSKALEAADGDRALTTLRTNQVDFVICDWNMPNMSGVDLLREVRGDPQLRDMPFLMVTAETGGDVVAEAIEEDVDGYIVKPFQARTLADKIKAILEARHSPDPVEQALQEGRRHLQQGRREEAVSLFEKLLEDSPNSPRVLLALGQALEAMQKDADALVRYRQAVENARRFVRGHDHLAALYLKLGDEESAESHLRQAVKISPRNPQRQLALGRLLMKRGDHQTGKAALLRAMEIAPEDAALAKEAGDILLAAGLHDDAAEAFHAAVHADPGMVHVFNRMGMAYRREGSYQKAMEEYSRALDLVQDDENLYYNLAVAQAEAGFRQEAMDSLRDALRLRPDFKEARELLERLRP